MKLERLIVVCCLFTLIAAPTSWAQVEEIVKLTNLVQELQKQVSEMQKTVNQQSAKIHDLENRQPQVQIPAPGVTTAPATPMSDAEFNEKLGTTLGGANKWLKDLKFGGDLRLRYETFQQTSGSTSETDDRNRFRFRLRYGAEKKFGDQMKIGFAMASAEASSGQNVDPSSTNVSFDNLFNFKDIFIEKAFATYLPAWAKVGPVSQLDITAGKLVNPFEKGSSELVWDRDVRPEGIYEKADFKLIDTQDFDLTGFATAGQFVLDEDASVSDATGGDAELFAYQAGFTASFATPYLEKPADLLAAVSYFSYDDYAQGGNFLIGTTSLARGNTVCVTNVTLCAQDFEILEYYGELSVYPYNTPIRPFVDLAQNVVNDALGDEDFAWAIGAKVGKAVKKGDWEAGYSYRWISANALPGFNDSDFGTTGHSGKHGNSIKLGYMFTDHIQLNAAAFFVRNLNSGTAGVIDEEQQRYQLDMSWKF